MTSYSVKWRSRALDELRKLPKEVAQRLVRRVDIAKGDPKHFLERLVGDPGYKLRAGDYRAIVDILDEEKVMVVRIVGHRKNIYVRNL